MTGSPVASACAVEVSSSGADLEPADHARLPADPGADEQGPAVRLALHDLGEVGAERLADEAAGLVQDLVEVVGAEGELAELREHGLLGQQLIVAGSLAGSP